MARGLTDEFLSDLQTGLLSPFLSRIKLDRSLCLAIREDYVNIYYRGGNLLRLSRAPDGYLAFFDPEYAGDDGGAFLAARPPAVLRSSADVASWLEFVPTLKLTMDLFLGRHQREEREVQQLMVRENNFGGMSRETDYYICDLEYASPHGRFDLVAVHWPSSSSMRKQGHGRRLVLVEVKYGDGALSGTAGLSAHIEDINLFLGDPKRVADLKQEMVTVFKQKRALGLVTCSKDVAAFSDAPPMLLLVLVNHDPESTKLRTALKELPPSPHAELYLASSCLMGYGLFDQAVLPLEEACTRLGTCF